jgi:D-arabinose 1-dehydrogenase-like Zn-dependent alcohol dehydrogenase
MKAMVLHETGTLTESWQPLEAADLPVPPPGPEDILVRVAVCGVCHTELDETEGRTRTPKLPVVLGHQVVGYVEQLGERAAGFTRGDRVGVAWIHHACGRCVQCAAGDENLCAEFRATGRDVDGGYAEYMAVPAAFAHPLPSGLTDADQDELLRLRYTEHLWMEREIKTVANVTRRDVREFLELAAQARLRPEVQQYRLTEANDALLALKRGGQSGAKVLRIH